jgi:hypothetical protein
MKAGYIATTVSSLAIKRVTDIAVKNKINEMEINGKNKNITHLYRIYEEVSTLDKLGKNNNCVILPDSCSILNKWKIILQ